MANRPQYCSALFIFKGFRNAQVLAGPLSLFMEDRAYDGDVILWHSISKRTLSNRRMDLVCRYTPQKLRHGGVAHHSMVGVILQRSSDPGTVVRSIPDMSICLQSSSFLLALAI